MTKCALMSAAIILYGFGIGACKTLLGVDVKYIYNIINSYDSFE